MASIQEHQKPGVILEVDGIKFDCQRNELAAHSPYFHAMFSNDFVEKDKDTIEIQGVDAAAMRFILQWLRDNSKIDMLRGEEILAVLQAAAMLQFEHLQYRCEETMVKRWLTAETCLFTAATADQLSLTRLHHKAFAFALWHFVEVRQSQAFLDLPLDALQQYISHDALSSGSNYEEFQVFEGVSSWLEYNFVERKTETLKVLSCIRMNFISTSDLQNMLNYASIDNCMDAQLLLKCIIGLKEGKVITSEQTPKQSLETPSLSFGENTGCCPTLQRIADHLTSCVSEVPSDGISAVIIDEREMKLNQSESDLFEHEFRPNILTTATQILSLPKRRLPIVACIIGHAMKIEKNSGEEEESNAQEHSHSKRNRKEKNKHGTPHIFFWDADRSDKLIPLLPLTKVDQGPNEALGYTVISRGQDLYVVGGEYLLGYGNWNKSVWRYNVWSGTWTYETSLAIPRRHHSVVCLDNNMYIIGGCGKFRVVLDSVDRYNFATNSWHKCAPLPTGLYSVATCVHKNLIYVISCQVFCYYPDTNTWVTLSDIHIPTGASFNTAMTYGNYIFLTGLYSADLMCFDPIGEKCIKRVGNFQNPAGDACLVGDKIYSFTENNEKPCIEVYDIESGNFKILWKGTSSDGKITFKKLGGCFSLVLYERLWYPSHTKGT